MDDLVGGIAAIAVLDGRDSRAITMARTHEPLPATYRNNMISVGKDHIAFAVIEMLQVTGLVLGRDISVAGYDGVDDSERHLCRVKIDGPLIARRAARVPEGWTP